MGAMQEGERLAYLQAMGITQYVPVVSIAGAMALPGLELQAPAVTHTPAVTGHAELPDADSAATVTVTATRATSVLSTEMAERQAPVEQSAPQPDISPGAVAALQADNANPAASADREIPRLDVTKFKRDEKPPPVTAPQTPALQRFALAVLTVPQRLRVLVQLGHPDAPGFSAAEFRMISDLLLALNASIDIGDSATKLYRWPAVNNARITADARSARDGLIAFLAGAQAAQPVAKTLFLGAAVAGCLHPAEIGTAFSLAEIDPGRASNPCLLTHSLTAMQQDWTLKASAWHQIRQFV